MEQKVITLNSWGFRSFSIRINDQDTEYIVKYNNQDLVTGIWHLGSVMTGTTLNRRLKEGPKGHTVRSLTRRWCEDMRQTIEEDGAWDSTSTFSIIVYDGHSITKETLGSEVGV